MNKLIMSFFLSIIFSLGSVRSQTPCPNLVINGDFSAGNTGFTSNLNLNCNCVANSYCVSNNLQGKCILWPSLSGNGGSGNFLIVDGSTSNSQHVWSTSVHVSGGTTYEYSFWVASVYPASMQTFDLGMIIDGFNVKTVNISQQQGIWQQYSVKWSAPTSKTIQIAIRQMTGGDYRDFGIDDIGFQCCNCEANFDASLLNNCGEVQFLNYATGPGPLSWSWNFGDGNTSTLANPIHHYSQCGNYNVCLTLSGADCENTYCQTVNVNDNTRPIAKCLPGSGIVLDGNCIASLNPHEINDLSSDDCEIASLAVSPGTFNQCGFFPVILTVTDWCGNTDACTSIVQVLESIPPVFTYCPSDTIVLGTVNADGICEAAIQFISPTATDNCAPSVVLTNSFNSTGNASGTYPSGVTTVTWTAQDDCMNEAVCSYKVIVECDSCYCENFTDMFVRWDRGAPSQQLACGANAIQLGCPQPGKSFVFTGRLNCEGDKCASNAPLNWALVRLPNTIVATGSETASPIFGINILPAWYYMPGSYELRLKGYCGSEICYCVLKFNMDCPDPCPCDIQSLSDAVEKGFTSMASTNSCKGCFAPIALSDCDTVEWHIGNMTPVPVATTVGNQAFCHNFSGSGNYNITMVVTRKRADGSFCEVFTKSQKVSISCSNLPDCSNSIFENSGFNIGAIAGGLNSGGALEGWIGVWGDPHVNESDGLSLDGWTVELSGNYHETDALSLEEPVCLQKNEGFISLRAKQTNADSPNNPNRRIVIGFGAESVFSNTQNEIAIPLSVFDSTDWMEIQIPFSLNDFGQLDPCGGMGQGVLVQPVVYITNGLTSEQGGAESYSSAQIDNICSVDILGGIGDQRRSLNLQAFPNPTPGMFTVTLPGSSLIEGEYQILDLWGKIVKTEKQVPMEHEHTFDLSSMPSGIYFIRLLENGLQIWTQRLIKQ